MNVLEALGSSDIVETLAAREKVFYLESIVKQVEQVELPLRHFFVGETYVGEMFIPAGVVLTGHIHTQEHIAICSKGHISIFDEYGLHDIKAGDIFISKPGIKRAGLAHEDTLFINVLKIPLDVDRNDPKAIREAFTVETYAEYDAFMMDKQNEKPIP